MRCKIRMRRSQGYASWTFDIHNMAALVQGNLDFLRGCLSRILSIENFAELLQRLASGFNEEEVDDYKLDANPDNIDL